MKKINENLYPENDTTFEIQVGQVNIFPTSQFIDEVTD